MPRRVSHRRNLRAMTHWPLATLHLARISEPARNTSREACLVHLAGRVKVFAGHALSSVCLRSLRHLWGVSPAISQCHLDKLRRSGSKNKSSGSSGGNYAKSATKRPAIRQKERPLEPLLHADAKLPQVATCNWELALSVIAANLHATCCSSRGACLLLLLIRLL